MHYAVVSGFDAIAKEDDRFPLLVYHIVNQSFVDRFHNEFFYFLFPYFSLGKLSPISAH